MKKILNLDHLVLLDNPDTGDLFARIKNRLIVSPICPDYSYHVVNSRYVYDFRQLNEGIGLTAQRLLEKAPQLLDLLRYRGVLTRYSILMADVEADDSLILGKVGLNRNEFVEKVKIGTQNLEAEAAGYEVQLMSDFFNPDDYTRAASLLGEIRDSKIMHIISSRNTLYSKLFTPEQGGDFERFTLGRARQDIARSLVFGSAARRQGVMILDVTDRQLGNFYNDGKGLPVAPLVSIEKNY